MVFLAILLIPLNNTPSDFASFNRESIENHDEKELEELLLGTLLEEDLEIDPELEREIEEAVKRVMRHD